VFSPLLRKRRWDQIGPTEDVPPTETVVVMRSSLPPEDGISPNQIRKKQDQVSIEVRGSRFERVIDRSRMEARKKEQQTPSYASPDMKLSELFGSSLRSPTSSTEYDFAAASEIFRRNDQKTNLFPRIFEKTCFWR
jgi:hypothetical protein